MIGIYFSATGNTQYCVSQFLGYYNNGFQPEIYSIEDAISVQKIKENSDIVFGYPIYYSDLPMIVREFINANPKIFKGKNIFIIVTMGLFSGDGAGCSARIFKKLGANILGALHLKMPDCIGDVKALKKPLEKNIQIVKEADLKIKQSVINLQNGRHCQDGLSIINHLAGLLGQRLWFYGKPYKLKDKLKIDYNKCISCGICAEICPMKNIIILNNKPVPQNNCMGCYRCFSNCSKKAITIIGNQVIEQSKIDKYI